MKNRPNNLVAKYSRKAGSQSRVFRDRKKDDRRGYTKHRPPRTQ